MRDNWSFSHIPKDVTLCTFLDCLVSAPQGATVADVSSEMKSAKKKQKDQLPAQHRRSTEPL